MQYLFYYVAFFTVSNYCKLQKPIEEYQSTVGILLLRQETSKRRYPFQFSGGVKPKTEPIFISDTVLGYHLYIIKRSTKLYCIDSLRVKSSL